MYFIDFYLSTMVQIAVYQPRFYLHHIEQVRKMMDIITKAEEADDEVRQKSLELLVKICESCPAMVSNNPDYIKTILLLCFKLMVEMDDLSLQEWNAEVTQR